MRSNFREYLKNFLLLVGSLIFCFLFLEIVLRIMTPTVFYPGLDLRPNQKILIHNLNLYGNSSDVVYTTNKWGMRGDSIPEDWTSWLTILAIGGSTTRDAYLSDDKTWVFRLQNLLRNANPEIMVQNAGLDGHSTRGHLLMMKTVVAEIKPKMVIILVGINDLGLLLVPERFLSGNPYEKTGWRYNVFVSSRALQFFYTWYQILFQKAIIIDKNAEGLSAKGYDAKPLIEETPLPANLEEILISLPEFRQNIKAIIDIAKRENIKVIFLTQPLLFEDNEYWRKIQGASWWLENQEISISAATYWKMLKIFNGALLEICRSEGASCFDLASAIPHEQKYFSDSAHFNEAGAALVAEKIFDFMKNSAAVYDFLKR